MDYEKAYKEALERAKESLKDGGLSQNSIDYIQSIFPELKVSEDERVRKALIDFFNRGAENGARTNGVCDKDILAWLEKQEMSYNKKDVDDAYLKGISDARNELEKQGEQILTNSAKTCKDEQKPQRMSIVYKPAWSEEDEYTLNETIQHLEELIRIDKDKYCACNVRYYQRDIDWLKSLKERMKGE